MPDPCIPETFPADEAVLWVREHRPAAWQGRVEMEESKLRASTEKFPDLPPEKNLPVSGRPGLTLPEVLERAEREYGHLTTEELRAMRMEHGHGVASRY